MDNHRGGDRQILGPNWLVNLTESCISRFCERLCHKNRQTKNKIHGSRGRTTPVAVLWPPCTLTHTCNVFAHTYSYKKKNAKIPMNCEDKFSFKDQVFVSSSLKVEKSIETVVYLL